MAAVKNPLFVKVTDNGWSRRTKSGKTRWQVGKVVKPKGAARRHPLSNALSPCQPGVLHFYVNRRQAADNMSIHLPWGVVGGPRKHLQRWFLVRPLGTVEQGYAKCWTDGPVEVVREIPVPYEVRKRCGIKPVKRQK